MTTFEHLRQRLLQRAGLVPPAPPRYTLRELEQSEWSAEFERYMRNRLIMGALRYGKIKAPGKRKWNRIAGIQKRLDQYAQTGNLETLVDVANLALLEFVEGEHPRRHFEAFDGDHSCV
jgi:hypothetical protein